MGLSKEAQVAALYNVKSQVDGMISAVRGNVLTIEQALKVLCQACSDLSDRIDRDKQAE